MRQLSGWVRIDRHILSGDKQNNEFHNPALRYLWINLILLANWKDSQTKLKKQKVVIKRGQLVCSERELATLTGCSKSVVHRNLDYLKNTKKIDQIKDHRGTIITILNYDKYQCIENVVQPAKGPEADQKRTRRGPKEDQKRTYHNNVPINNVTTEQGTTDIPKPVVKIEASSSPVWNSYAVAYARRYKTDPTRNAKNNALCKQLVKRLGAEDAPKVAAFYLTHNDRWYVQKLHLLEYAVKDAEKLHTEWKRGLQMTGKIATSLEQQSSNEQAIAEHLRSKYGSSV